MVLPEKHRRENRYFPLVPNDPSGGYFTVFHDDNVFIFIAAIDEEWEHLTVYIRGSDSCPTWLDMKWAKGLFWEPEDCVVQYHPPESDYIDNCRTALHLWKNRLVDIPRPPSILVGVKTL